MLVYASLGDTMIIACDDQGQYNVLTINTVKNINCRADFNRKINRYKGENIPDETFFTNKQNKIRYNRFMANKPNGYSVANGMEEVKNTIQYGMLDTKNLKYVLIMSDGLFDLEEDIKTLFHEVINKGLAAYVEQLTAWEQEQGLSSDDKTAVLLHF
ncbi:hypothetical protein RWE15_03320 [Virgibacillus halophilus]|uniref:Protein phosphatase 2C n=1 Tax=Tigheibacillus halophilus TaxID=361280 RepID=A0ABU5C2V6_9BACI|nr:hypothetical protein [Virgibacillus halophilus]